MKFTIKDNCIRCGACAIDCPVGAIKMGNPIFIIDHTCIACGDCYTICPVGAVERVVHEASPCKDGSK